jgi:hypothetical protein
MTARGGRGRSSMDEKKDDDGKRFDDGVSPSSFSSSSSISIIDGLTSMGRALIGLEGASLVRLLVLYRFWLVADPFVEVGEVEYVREAEGEATVK